MHEEFKRGQDPNGVAVHGGGRDDVLGLAASAQITMRKVDGWQTLFEITTNQTIDLAA